MNTFKMFMRDLFRLNVDALFVVLFAAILLISLITLCTSLFARSTCDSSHFPSFDFLTPSYQLTILSPHALFSSA